MREALPLYTLAGNLVGLG